MVYAIKRNIDGENILSMILR